jgi:hypothetical protein
MQLARTTRTQTVERILDASSISVRDVDLDQFPPTLLSPHQRQGSTRHVNGRADSPERGLGSPPGLGGLNDSDNEGAVEVSADRRCGGIRPYMDFQSHVSHTVGKKPPGEESEDHSGLRTRMSRQRTAFRSMYVHAPEDTEWASTTTSWSMSTTTTSASAGRHHEEATIGSETRR